MFKHLLATILLIPALAQGSYTTKGDTLHAGYVHNLGLSYAASTLKIVGASGADLSAANAGKVAVGSVTSGQTVVLSITAATHLFIDDSGASDITDEQFGVTSTRVWDQDRPFYLYLVNKDDTDSGVAFAISPKPNLKQTPAGAAGIGYHDTPMTTPADTGMWFLTAVDITATHNSKPCVRIGGIRMQMSILDDWTVQALDYSKGDGIRPDPFVGEWFTMVDQQMGAAAIADNYLLSAVGNPPTWAAPANTTYRYQMDLDSRVHVLFNTANSGDCAAGGAGLCFFILPYIINADGRTLGADAYVLVGQLRQAGTFNGAHVIFTDAVTACKIGPTIGTLISCNEFNNVLDDFTFHFSYAAL